MRTFALVGTALALIAIASCAPPPAPKEYAYPDWGFAAAFQAQPKVTETKASADGSQPHMLMVEAKAAGHDFAVTAIDASSATGTPEQILDYAPQTFAKASDFDVGATTKITLGPVSGREIRFEKDFTPTMLMRIFVAGGRFYEVTADTPKGVNDPQVKGFLDSFRLLGAAAAPPPAANTADNAAPANAAPSNSAN